MTETEAQGLKLDIGERLPWLEPAQEEYEEPGVSAVKIVSLVLVGLLLLGLIVGGGYWLKTRDTVGADSARLIAAPGGDYKLPANQTDGKLFTGTGDTSYATSEGVDTDGKVDANLMPETPMADVSRGSIAKDEGGKASAGAAKPAASISAAVKDETKTKATGQPLANGSSGGAMIQLGAYGSEAVAQDSWKKLAKRFDYLVALGSVVQKAEVGGATVYRLRASAGSATEAGALCGRLKVAGENCLVVK